MESEDHSMVLWSIKNDADVVGGVKSEASSAANTNIQNNEFLSRCCIEGFQNSHNKETSSVNSAVPVDENPPVFTLSCIENAGLRKPSLPNPEKFTGDYAEGTTTFHQSSSDPGPTFSRVEHHLLCSALDWSLYASFNSCIDEIMAAGQISHNNRQGLVTRITKLADIAVCELSSKGYFGVCRLLGALYATNIRDLILSLYSEGIFQPGEHAQKGEEPIRSDFIAWVGPDQLAKLPSPALRILLAFLDGIIIQTGARLGVDFGYKTRAMLACYPRKDTGYDKHFDNPNVLNDGRYLTCLYYLNPDWLPERDGGQLILWPSTLQGQEVVLAPLLDRAVFFFSDERTLHQVRPSVRDRFAITVWYFDTPTRQKYWERRRQSLTKVRRVSIPLPPDNLLGCSSNRKGENK